MAKSKDYCIILDNVGNFWNFGLPSDDRDWRMFFSGYDNKSVKLFTTKINEIPPYVIQRFTGTPKFNEGEDGKLEMVANHLEQKDDIGILRTYHIVKQENGFKGLNDRNGNIIIPYEYRSLEISRDGIATVKGKRNFFLDLYNGLEYPSYPKIFRIKGFPVAVCNGEMYFRVRSKYIGKDSFVDLNQILPFPLCNILRWKEILFYHEDGGWKTYRIVKKSEHGGVVCEGENGGFFTQSSPYDKPLLVKSLDDGDKFLEKFESDYRQWLIQAKSYFIGYAHVQGMYPHLKGKWTKECCLYAISSIRRSAGNGWNYSVKFNRTHVKALKIELPVIESSDPKHTYTPEDIDWKYMNERIKELENERIKELENERIKELDAYLKVTGLDDYELSEEDKKLLSLSLQNPHLTKSDLWKIISTME